MRRPHPLAVAALLVALIVAACEEPSPPAPAAPPVSERDNARREVLAAAIDSLATDPDPEVKGRVPLVDATLQPTRTHDEEDALPPERAAHLASLPDGRRVFRPQIETLATETFNDWVAHTAPVPAPRDLITALSIEWRSEADSKERARSSMPSIFIALSNVGFSPSRHQALLQASRSGESCTSGFWLLLERKDDRWAVVQRKRTFIGCACAMGGDPNITPVDK